jgi:transglutaminase/protease-like cytokinesis protein 3
MPEERKSQKSWWQTIPGLLTAAAGVITAITGLIIALHQAEIPGETGPKKPSESTSPAANPKDTENKPNPPSVTDEEKKTNSETQVVAVTYKVHVANIGWMKWVENGEIAGTTGQGKRIEAIFVKLDDAYPNMGIKYRAHVANLGWMDWVSDGKMAGTTGENRQIEAIQIKLTNAPLGYRVNYQAHVSHMGWLNWVSDGEIAGTTGQGKQMEAIRIKIISPIKN